MTHDEIRALCHRFFDALEAGNIDTLAAIYDDRLAFWFNASDKTSTKAESLAAVTMGAGRHRRRRYNDRAIQTFDGGFVMQYTLNIEHNDGAPTALYPAVVALCRDGRIFRMDEYIDSGKFKTPLSAKETK
jgi:ketosteroid isomerase-like protein